MSVEVLELEPDDVNPDQHGIIVAGSQAVEDAISELGEKRAEDFRGQEIHRLELLYGAKWFNERYPLDAHLCYPRRISRYGASDHGGKISVDKVEKTLRKSEMGEKQVKGRHFEIVDDLIDGGDTLVATALALRRLGAESVHATILAFKNGVSGRGVDFEVKPREPVLGTDENKVLDSIAIGLVIPNYWVFGCGMDGGGGFNDKQTRSCDAVVAVNFGELDQTLKQNLEQNGAVDLFKYRAAA